jgi:hypothetical protein
MATYCFFGESANNNAVPYGEFGNGLSMRRKVDIPYLIANPGKLALASDPNTPLTSFSGFVQNDILELFQCPIGYLPLAAAMRVKTAEGATAASKIGLNAAFSAGSADDDGLLGTANLNGAAGDMVCSGPTDTAALSADAFGTAANSALQIAESEGAAIIQTFTTNDNYAVAIYDVAVFGVMLLPENMER